MRKSITLVASVIAAAACTVPSAQAYSGATTCQSKAVKVTYSANYHAVKKLHGKRAPGRNIRKWGLTKSKPSRCRDLRKSTATLRAMRMPPPVAVHLRATTPYVPPAATSTLRARTSGTGAMPSCADESHGNYSTGPENTNPSSGATGRWQTLRSHYAPGGICHADDMNSPSGQDQCAARILATQGSGAWVNC